MTKLGCPCALLTEHHAMKTYWRSGGIAPRIIDLGTGMEMIGQLHAPAALLPGKEPRYPLGRRMGGPQNRCGHGGEEKNSQPLPGLEPPIIQPAAQHYTTELSRLHHPRVKKKSNLQWHTPYIESRPKCLKIR
jgi:hypothetical protein